MNNYRLTSQHIPTSFLLLTAEKRSLSTDLTGSELGVLDACIAGNIWEIFKNTIFSEALIIR